MMKLDCYGKELDIEHVEVKGDIVIVRADYPQDMRENFVSHRGFSLESTPEDKVYADQFLVQDGALVSGDMAGGKRTVTVTFKIENFTNNNVKNFENQE